MRYILAMVGAAVLWSTSGLFIKTSSIDELAFTGWRSGIAAVTLFVVARAMGIRVGVPRTRLAWFTVVAYALILLLFVLATKRTTAANAIFLQYTAPVYVLIFEPLFLKSRFRMRDVGFVTLALVGMGLFFVGRDETAGAALAPSQLVGNMLALASGVFFGAFAVALRARHEDAGARWQAVSWGNLVLFAGVAVYFLVNPGGALVPSTWEETWGLIFSGALQIGIAYALFAYAISGLSALESILIGMLEPVLNPIWVFLKTGEQPSNWALAGAALIVLSIVSRTWLEAGGEVSGGGRREAEEPTAR